MLSIINLFIAIGVSSIMGSLLSAYLLNREQQFSITALDSLQYKEIFISFFSYGKWALFASLFIWASNDIYYFILSKYNMNYVGELKLVRNLFLPFFHVIIGLNYYLLPSMTKKLKNNSPINIYSLLVLLSIASIIYSSFIIIFADTIFDLVYNKRIADMHDLIAASILSEPLSGE